MRRAFPVPNPAGPRYVGAGGLGELIDTGYKLNNWLVLSVGAVLSMALALLVDWLGALAETYLSPRGLR